MKKTHSESASAYELMLVLLPDLGEDATNKELDEIRKLLTANGGEIYHEDIWGTQEMEYTIKKHDHGYYAVLNFRTEPENLKEIEKTLNINAVVLRFLVIKTPATYKIVTFSEYKEVAEEEAKEVAAAKKAKEESRSRVVEKPIKPIRKAVVKKEEEVVVAPAAPVVEEKEAAPAKAPKAAPKKANLEEVDKRLKSIIDDPDITL